MSISMKGASMLLNRNNVDLAESIVWTLLYTVESIPIQYRDPYTPYYRVLHTHRSIVHINLYDSSMIHQSKCFNLVLLEQTETCVPTIQLNCSPHQLLHILKGMQSYTICIQIVLLELLELFQNYTRIDLKKVLSIKTPPFSSSKIGQKTMFNNVFYTIHT